jgi:hypothetical protein
MIGEHTHEEQRKDTKGAKKLRSPRELLDMVYVQYPNADERLRCTKWREACEDEGEEVVSEVWWQAFAKMRPPERRNPIRQTPEEMMAQRAAAIAEIKAAAHRSERQWLLRLNFTMPNGKALGDCTGMEVGKFGRLFEEIARTVGDRLVKEVYRSDDDLPKPVE